ncbi:NAC domain-containing protein 14-like [Tasmannia lanceolata]|uniref:NAC domain-containing protein 14-like n=1 Tax=Tasmannia lanceolata TaxID=3420 RepID=UPI0040634138
MAVLTTTHLPTGLDFRPFDEELVNYYLQRKIQGLKSEVEFPVVDVCKFEPWDLPSKSLIETKDQVWFFFSPLDRKYAKGHRFNRATEAGQWKSTGKDRSIKLWSPDTSLIGKKKTLVFHIGRAPDGKGTRWIIHEYRVTKKKLAGKNDGGQGGFVLCRLFKKNPDKDIGNSKCDEMDGDSDVDKGERSDLSPTTTGMPSPEETQNAGDAFMQFETTLKQGIPVLHMQEKPQPLPVSIKHPVNIEMLLADKANNGTSYPSMSENVQHNNCMASDVEDHKSEVVATEVDTLLQDFDMFYEPTFEPAKQLVNSEMLLADKADNGTSYPSIPDDVQYNNCMASDIEDQEAELAATEVDPLLQAFGMFFEPLFEPIENQPVNIEGWLSDKAGNGSSFPSMPEHIQYDNYMASGVEYYTAEVVAREVNPPLQAFGMFYDPAFEPLDPPGFSDAYGAWTSSCDSPFYDYSMKVQQMGIFQDGRVDQDTSSVQSITEFLDGVFNNEDEHSSFEDSSCRKDLVVDTTSEPGAHCQQNQFFSGNQGWSQQFEFASGGADNEG